VPLPQILEHIREIADTNLPIILRVPVIPGYTDAPDNLRAIAEFVRTLKGLRQIELLPFHQLGRPKYRQLGKPYILADLATISEEAMLEAKRIFTATGLKAIIAGKE
jgi:pyruvate formate lyase activating enzyme